MVAVRLAGLGSLRRAVEADGQLPLVILVGLLKVSSRTWFGSSLPPPPSRRRSRQRPRQDEDQRDDRGVGSAAQVKLSRLHGGSLLRARSRPLLSTPFGRGRVANPPEAATRRARIEVRACVIDLTQAASPQYVSFVTWVEGLAPAAAPRTPSGRASACPAAPSLAPSCPAAAPRSPPGAKFCIECGTRAWRRADPSAAARRRRPPRHPAEAPAWRPPQRPSRSAAGCSAASSRRARRPGAARRGRSAGGAPQGDGAVRRPLRLHGGRRAHGSRGGEVVRRPGAAAPRPGGGPLRRLGRQVHRRQRDGGLRRAGRPRGRPGARRARRPRDAGGDGGDQQGDRPRRPTSASRCGSGSTRATCSPARSATATR